MNIPEYKNENHVFDGTITIQKDCFAEPEIHEKVKKLPSGKKKTIVKKIDSIQNFGAMNILCTDKTGTLTEDKIVLEKYLDVYGNEDERVLKHTFLIYKCT